jgi:hypothetical protein
MAKFCGTWTVQGQYPREGLSTPCSRQLQHGHHFAPGDNCDTRGPELVHGKATYRRRLQAKDSIMPYTMHVSQKAEIKIKVSSDCIGL